MQCVNGVVVWDENSAAEFKEMYPVFQAVPDATLEIYFELATTIVDNSKCSLVPCKKRLPLFVLLIAWMAEDFARGAGIVGQVSSATQGSVSLGINALNAGQAAAPFMSNHYGELFWMATTKYRSFQYYPDPKKRWRSCFWPWCR